MIASGRRLIVLNWIFVIYFGYGCTPFLNEEQRTKNQERIIAASRSTYFTAASI